MGQGFGFYDVRRWRMVPFFLNKAAIGLWATKKQATSNNMTLYKSLTDYSDGINGALTENNLFLFNDPLKEGKGWLELFLLFLN